LGAITGSDLKKQAIGGDQSPVIILSLSGIAPRVLRCAGTLREENKSFNKSSKEIWRLNMKRTMLSVLLILLGVLVSACGGAPAANASNVSPEPATVEDQASLIAALEAAGATVESGEPLSQPFLSVEGSIIKVNGADVQVFEYENSEAMELDSSQIAPDGSSNATTMISWIDTPHFYKSGRIIALYIGSDEAVLSLLENALGSQFAGG
jgi:hypothetical protein